MLYTTLNKIRACHPCKKGWTKLLANLGKTEADDEPLGFDTILASNGLDDALWCCQTVPEYSKTWRLYVVWCARPVQHLMQDPRSNTALDVAERPAHGLATDEELEAARKAAWDMRAAARDAAWDMRAAARDAAWAARNAARAAALAAWERMNTTVSDASARDAARAVSAARDVARKAQEAKFIEMINQE